MESSNIEIDNIKINNKYISYEDKRIELKSEWYTTYYNKEYKNISVPMSKDDYIYKVLKHIDDMIEKVLPEDYKQTKILKTYNDKTYVKPKFEYANIYDENKKQVTIKALQKSNIECRFI